MRLMISLRLGAFALAFFVSIISISAKAAVEAADSPFLRIETGKHTARINRIATDASGRLVATVSNDKTLRLWARETGEAIAVLRAPIEDGEEGSLYAVALSADGKLAVASGNTGSTWGDGVALYLFDVEGRRLKARLPGQPHVVNHLAFSPDGRYVAGVFGGGAGLRVWDSKTFSLVAEDPEYGVRATWAAFDRSGRLATVAADGVLRLYDSSFKLIAKRAAPGGKDAYSVAFSPDGERVAVGYAQTPRVDVLRGKDLKALYTPTVSGGTAGGFAAVAWVVDGGSVSLAAAGAARTAGAGHILRRWSDGGKGKAADTIITGDSVNQVVGAPDGGVLFAAADPAWGLVDRSGRVVYRQGSDTGDFRNIFAGRFAVSNDGLVVEFGMEMGGVRPFRFDALQRKLTVSASADEAPTLQGPIVDAPQVQITDWRNTQAPKHNGVVLPLDAAEWARSLAFTPDHQAFLLGGEFGLRLHHAGTGMELHRIGTPGPVWGVAVSGNGRVAVAALGDGTIRWYGIEGTRLQERGALFPHRNGRQWVLWTPEAFFDHSESGGDTLVGVHLNDGKKRTPLWMEFGQVHRVLYDPDMVRDRLAGSPRDAARERLAKIGDLRRLALRRPKVTLDSYCFIAGGARAFRRTDGASGLSAMDGDCRAIDTSSLTRAFAVVRPAGPPDGQSEEEAPAAVVDVPPGVAGVRLRFNVTDGGDGVGAIQVFRNGRNVSAEGATRGFGRIQDNSAVQLRERTVLFEPGSNRVQVKAYNRTEAVHGASQIIDFIAPRPVSPEIAEAKPKPKLLLLVAGVNEYASPRNRLSFARNDAEAFAQKIKSGLPSVYDRATSVAGSQELYDHRATRASIVAALEAVGRESEKDDTVIIYLAGHGLIVPSREDPSVSLYHFIPHDVESEDQVSERALSEKDLTGLISGIRADKLLLVLDTCHAGGFSTGSVDRFYQELGRNRYMLAASASSQEALDSYDGQHGVFARAVLDGLGGQARFADETMVYHLSLGDYVRRHVPRLAAEKRWSQNAFFKTGGVELSGFPLVEYD